MTISAIIIEGGQRARRLNASESRPRSLDAVDSYERPVLDWILHAFELVGVKEPIYIGGYHIEKVITRFPKLQVRYHGQRDTEGELGSLLRCDLERSPLLIVNAATVLLPGACERLIGKAIARGIYAGSQAVGVFFLASEQVDGAVEQAQRIIAADPMADLDALFQRLPGVEGVDLEGLAAPITDQQAVARSIFRGKAQTLDHLAPVIRTAAHLPRERVRLTDWQRDEEAVLDRIGRAFPNTTIIVRSSTDSEDGLTASAAGKYLSVAEVKSANRESVRRAIDAVTTSYSSDGRKFHPNDEFLVQPHLQNLAASGVLLTRDPQTGAPYFIINEDRTSGRSDLVTGGKAAVLHQHFTVWSGLDAAKADSRTGQLLDIGCEVMQTSRLDALDIEYAIDGGGICHLLQARPLAAARNKTDVADEDVFDLIAGAREFVRGCMRPLSGLAGASTVFGVMPDWNPAEMIGLTPRPLALSLYQSLIGNDSWAEARKRIGYRDVRPERLIVALGGRPYVDVRASLNSFIPAKVGDKDAARWVDACLAQLCASPILHDKIEFEVSVTCLAPDWSDGSRRLANAGVDVEEYAEQLRCLTAGVLSGTVEPIEQQFFLLDQLGRRQGLLAETTFGVHGRLRVIAQLLEDCRQFGIVPFAILARYAFISMNFLRGFLQRGVIDESNYHRFLSAVPTVAGEMAADLQKEYPLTELVAKYGHLRPNSYEITSPNYATKPEQFLRPSSPQSVTHANLDAESCLKPHAAAIQRTLEELGLGISFEQLIFFMIRSISGRERAKFEFMKNLNAALEELTLLGSELDLSREEMSFLAIDDVLRLEANSLAKADSVQLHRRAAFNEKRWAVTRALRLPDLIRNPDEIVSFRMEPWRANFVTNKHITARAVWLDDADAHADLAGAIVVARAADPGYDWIFAHGIVGLVTEFGGVASHMSIRAAEFGLPAAIGCGAIVMDSLCGAKVIELDCAAERVRRLA